MKKITDLKSCIAHIKEYEANHPHSALGSIRVGKRVLNKIKKEIKESVVVKDAPRPTYGPPWGDIDRFLWDEHQRLLKLAPVTIFGVSVEA